jgi:hypothetical protein
MDFGESSFPVFEDIDGDALPDLIVGGNGYYQSNGNYLSGLAYYHNVGSIGAPSFELISRDWQNLQSNNCKGMAPSFGDLDNDGDRDMLAGATDGRLNYFTKQANGTYVLTQAYFQNIDVGENATPQLVDVNEDGLLDLLIGEKWGNVNYYRNTGSVSSPIFTLQTTNFGNVDVRENGNLTGFSAPHLCKLKQGDTRTLLVGNESGHLLRYSNIDQNLNGTFTLQESHFSQLELGGPASVFTANLIGGDTSELAVGMFGGGIKLMEWDKQNINDIAFTSTENNISIYPNPSNQYTTIHSEQMIEEIRIYNIIGIAMIDKRVYCNKIDLDTSSLLDGIYVVQIRTKKGLQNSSLQIVH